MLVTGRKIPSRKIKIVKELTELIKKHKVIAIANLYGLRSNQLQELRRILREKAIIKVAKNTLMRRAIDNCLDLKPGIDKLIPYLKGQNAFIFLNDDPFSLILTLNKHKIMADAKPGDVAPNDVIIFAGNTGLPPGPIMSKFSMFKIPVKIEEGSIWITKDTVVVRKGEVINADLADLLKRLGIKPIEVKLDVKAAYFDGLVLSSDDLYIDLDKYKEELAEAQMRALALSVNIAFPTKENATLLVSKAVREARALAVASAIPVPELIPQVIQYANMQAMALASKISKISPELGIAIS